MNKFLLIALLFSFIPTVVVSHDLLVHEEFTAAALDEYDLVFNQVPVNSLSSYADTPYEIIEMERDLIIRFYMMACLKDDNLIDNPDCRFVERCHNNNLENSDRVCGGEFHTRDSQSNYVDHFIIARLAAYEYCNEYTDDYAVGEIILPKFYGPSSFITINLETGEGAATEGHHVYYNLNHKLKFKCGYLEYLLPDF